MPIQAKRQLARLAAKYQLPVIEDTVYSDLQFGEPLQPSVRSFDEERWVMVCGGFSKMLAPDYRLGWLEGGRFSHEIRRLKFTASATESVLLSDTIGSYMLSGGYDRHLRALRRIYQSNIETIRGLVASHYPEGTRATQPDGGFILWLELPTHVHATALFRQALEREVVFMPGELYSDGPRFIIACESRAAEPRMMNLSMRSSLLVLSRSEAVRKCSPGGRAIGM
jgi:DNA-binding transcriptional MocR family regulator